MFDVLMKICTKCKKLKPVSEFGKDKYSNGGLTGACKKCRNKVAKKRQRRYVALNKKKGVSLKGIADKKCYICKKKKQASEFRKDITQKDGIGASCKKCSVILATIWRNNNQQKSKATRKAWNLRNPNKLKQYDAKRRSTPQGRLNRNIRSDIAHSLNRGKSGRHWENLVGYTIIDLRKHLEPLFKDGMDWNNYGKVWHIDHKIPISVFNFTKPEHEDFKRCWELKNLQPLFAHDNLTKHAKIKHPFQPSLRLEVWNV